MEGAQHDPKQGSLIGRELCMSAPQLRLCRSTGQCVVLGLKSTHSCSEGQVTERHFLLDLQREKRMWMQIPCEHAMATRKIQGMMSALCNQLAPLVYRIWYKQRSETCRHLTKNKECR